jgi:hypothetical protein
LKRCRRTAKGIDQGAAADGLSLELELLLGAGGLEPGLHESPHLRARIEPAVKPIRDTLRGHLEGLGKLGDPSTAGLAEGS